MWLALFLLFNAAESERIFKNDETDQRSQYTASWAVEITEGGEKMAERIARRYGFINAGKVRRDLTCERYWHILPPSRLASLKNYVAKSAWADQNDSVPSQFLTRHHALRFGCISLLFNVYRWPTSTTYTTSSSAVRREPEHQLISLMTVKVVPFFLSPV